MLYFCNVIKAVVAIHQIQSNFQKVLVLVMEWLFVLVNQHQGFALLKKKTQHILFFIF